MIASPHLRSKGTRGFTLLEICISLIILIIIVGSTVPVVSGLSIEQQLRDPVRKLEMFAKTARRLAVHDATEYEIVFNEKDFVLRPSIRPKDPKKKKSFSKSYQMKSGTTYLIQNWQSTQWKKPNKDRWVFVQTGLCEPIKLHVKKGNAWFECTFHPLTGAIQEESFHIPK